MAVWETRGATVGGNLWRNMEAPGSFHRMSLWNLQLMEAGRSWKLPPTVEVFKYFQGNKKKIDVNQVYFSSSMESFHGSNCTSVWGYILRSSYVVTVMEVNTKREIHDGPGWCH